MYAFTKTYSHSVREGRSGGARDQSDRNFEAKKGPNLTYVTDRPINGSTDGLTDGWTKKKDMQF